MDTTNVTGRLDKKRNSSQGVKLLELAFVLMYFWLKAFLRRMKPTCT